VHITHRMTSTAPQLQNALHAFGKFVDHRPGQSLLTRINAD
jgi:hypothetical protein